MDGIVLIKYVSQSANRLGGICMDSLAHMQHTFLQCCFITHYFMRSINKIHEANFQILDYKYHVSRFILIIGIDWQKKER